MSTTNYIYWTKPRLLARILELEAEVTGLRQSLTSAIEAIQSDNDTMREFLNAEERIWEMQDPIEKE
jgi:hypothetical protein